MKRLKHHGFTIIELMIASVVFATLLLLATFVIIQIGRYYQKGLTTSRTQETIRKVTDEIAAAIEFGSKTPVVKGPAARGGSDTYALCIGKIRYTFIKQKRVVKSSSTPASGETRHALWREEDYSGTCTDADMLDITVANPVGVNGRELLGNNTSLEDLQVNQVDDKGRLWQISIKILAGPTDLIDTDPVTNKRNCKKNR